LKIKLGSDYIEDIERLCAINDVVDKNISLKVDANQGWSQKDSVRFLNAIEGKNIAIDFLEQPVKRFDIEGLKYIKERTTTPIVADESMFSPMDAIKILENKAADMINIKLDKCGGISKAIDIAHICELYGVKCMIGCMMQGAISVGAAAHVASALSDTVVIYDLDSPMHCKISPVVGGVDFNAPNVSLSVVDGLGVRDIEGIAWL
jgi:L-alanine-DL-glutamate epimerase-like enolase superfamily enzyme